MGVPVPRCATPLHPPRSWFCKHLYKLSVEIVKWLYKSTEQNYFHVHKSYSCVHGHWMRDSVKTWQLLWITYKRQPAEGNKYVCLKPVTLQWITFLEIKDQQKSLNSLLKILYFFKTIKANPYFKLTVFTFNLKGLLFFFFKEHRFLPVSIQTLWIQPVIFKGDGKKSEYKKEEKYLVQVFSS